MPQTARLAAVMASVPHVCNEKDEPFLIHSTQPLGTHTVALAVPVGPARLHWHNVMCTPSAPLRAATSLRLPGAQ